MDSSPILSAAKQPAAPVPSIARAYGYTQANHADHPAAFPGSDNRMNGTSTREPSLNFDGFDDGTSGLAEGPSRPSHISSQSIRSRDSNISLAYSGAESVATSLSSLLPALQAKGVSKVEDFHPLPDDELDPGSFDIVAPTKQADGVYSLVKRSEALFSKEHMGAILGDSLLLSQFSQFLAKVRPRSVRLLSYYLDSEKAIRAMRYADSVASGLQSINGYDFTYGAVEESINSTLQAKHDAAFELLTQEELPMFITHVWIRIVSLSIKQRVMGTMPAHLREASEGLAEVFCLTDPSRDDNPIILASSEFHRTTQYGIDDVIGRNCRFLQGPGTNPFSVKRIKAQLAAGKEHFETFLNYRRDGSPFMNLLLCAPLIDSRGTVRYFLGAQVDVSGLARDCTELQGLKRIVEGSERSSPGPTKNSSGVDNLKKSTAESCRDLSEMFSRDEVDLVRRHGGAMHATHAQGHGSNGTSKWEAPYLVLEDGTSPQESPRVDVAEPDMPASQVDSPLVGPDSMSNGRLAGIYENYVLVRPGPGFQILFASPSLRVPGMLQSPFLSRIGGSGRIRDQLARALGEGRGVTAKVQWLSSSSTRHYVHPSSNQGRPRWLHCTPLRGVNGVIGAWMIVIVNDEDVDASHAGRAGDLQAQQPKLAPPIETHSNRKPPSITEGNGGWPSVWQG